MFIRKKVAKGETYYQVVENERVDGKVRQKVLMSLGQNRTLGEALEAKRAKLNKGKREVARLERICRWGASQTWHRRLARLQERLLLLWTEVDKLAAWQAEGCVTGK